MVFIAAVSRLQLIQQLDGVTEPQTSDPHLAKFNKYLGHVRPKMECVQGESRRHNKEDLITEGF